MCGRSTYSSYFYRAILFYVSIMFFPALSSAADEVVKIDAGVVAEAKIVPLQSFFSGGSWETPISEPTFDLLHAIKLKKLRLINIEKSDYLRINVDGSSQYTFSKLDAALSDCVRFNLKPHIVVGLVSQDALATVRSSDPDKFWTLYKAYAYAFMRHVLEKGFTNVDFEVGNEPDINGTKWILERSARMGAASSYQEYFKVYATWASAADKLRIDFPKSQLRIGGPAITPYSLGGHADLNWFQRFIVDAAQAKLRLDFFSLHFYGNTAPLGEAPRFGPYPSFGRQISSVRGWLATNGYSQTSVYITEWGANTDVVGNKGGWLNGSIEGAVWSAAFAIAMSDAGVDEAMPLILRDNKDPKTGVGNENWPSFLKNDGVSVKPLYAVARIFSSLPPDRIAVSQGHSTLKFLAARDLKRISVIVVNASWDYARQRDVGIARSVHLDASHLGFSGLASVKLYKISKTDGGFDGLPVDKLVAQEARFVQVNNQAVSLDLILNPSSLILLEIEDVN